jgi:hypothetical protein
MIRRLTILSPEKDSQGVKDVCATLYHRNSSLASSFDRQHASPELIAMEHRRDESGLKRRESGLKLLVTRDNPDGSEMLRKITGSKSAQRSKSQPKFIEEARWHFEKNLARFLIGRCHRRLAIVDREVDWTAWRAPQNHALADESDLNRVTT